MENQPHVQDGRAVILEKQTSWPMEEQSIPITVWLRFDSAEPSKDLHISDTSHD
jgi:hypothetical protein